MEHIALLPYCPIPLFLMPFSPKGQCPPGLVSRGLLTNGSLGAMAHEVKRAGRAQHGGEVGDRAIGLQRFIVKRGYEAGRRQVLAGRDLVQQAPEGGLQLNAGGMAAYAHGAIDLPVAFRVLLGENLAHGLLRSLRARTWLW